MIQGDSELDLNNNQISSIESGAFNGLNTLYTLDLSKNQLTSVDMNIFAGLDNLSDLYLGGNQITALSDDFYNRTDGFDDVGINPACNSSKTSLFLDNTNCVALSSTNPKDFTANLTKLKYNTVGNYYV